MSIKTLSLRASALALFATVALSASAPAVAAPRAAAVTAHSVTDVSAARRHHHVQRNRVRDAYGAYVGSASGGTPSPLPYGNGVGDNSRNQTW
jgi:hypothetical protein